MTDTVLRDSDHAVRIVFFGLPGSGKTALLNAAARYAGQGAEDAPLDLTLAPEAGEAPLIPLERLVDRPGKRSETGAVDFLDCDGRAARELLTQADRLRRKDARSGLAETIRTADALVLVIDATWDPSEVDSAFRNFEQFLEILEEVRAREREVGGLPIFLTLTKCDALFRPGDEGTDWLERVVSRADELKSRFREWFDSQTEGPFCTFGSTELSLHRTAIALPTERGFEIYRDDSGGFGIAEFFLAIEAAARQFKHRRKRSRKRLNWMAGIAIGLLALILVALLGLAATRVPAPLEALAQRVERLRSREGPPEVRFSEARLENNRKEWETIRQSELFERLQPELRTYIDRRTVEAEAYAELRERFSPPQFCPADVRTQSDVNLLKSDLLGRLALPPQYAEDWRGTELAALHSKWTKDLEILTRAEEETHSWFAAQLKRLDDLRLANVPSARWTPSGWKQSLDAAIAWQPPAGDETVVPGSEPLPIHRGEALRYATVLRFERTANAARDCLRSRQRLKDLGELTDLLGLTGKENDAFLRIPSPSSPADSKALASKLLAKLNAGYPEAEWPSKNWTLPSINGPLREELGARFKIGLANGRDHVRRLIAAETNGKALVTPEGLLRSPELAAWGKLLRQLERWAEPERPDVDPVSELIRFLETERFEWKIERFEIALPSSLKVKLLKPDGPLRLRLGEREVAIPQSENDPGEGRRFRFEMLQGPATFHYSPGETFAAELDLTDGETKYRLKWDAARIKAFAFDALAREPTIETIGPNAIPQRADGVTVRAKPDSARFNVPELLPEVK